MNLQTLFLCSLLFSPSYTLKDLSTHIIHKNNFKVNAQINHKITNSEQVICLLIKTVEQQKFM